MKEIKKNPYFRRRLLKAKEEAKPDLDKLQAAVNDAASVARVNYLFFLAVLLYFVVLVQSTTHEQLFKNSDIQLPGLNIGVSIYNFYFAAPWIVMLLHLNVIFQHYILVRKIIELERELEKGAENIWRRWLASPFFLSDAILAHGLAWPLRLLVGIFVFVTVLVGPTIVLIYAQGQFLPYHAVGVTSGHQWLVRIDIFAQAMVLFFVLVELFRAKSWWRLFAFYSLFLLALMIWRGEWRVSQIAVVPEEKPEKCDKNKTEEFVNSGFKNIDCLFTRRINVSSKTLIAKEPPEEVISHYLKEGKSREQAIIDHAQELNVGGRDFRWANMSSVTAPRIKLEYAQLQGADMKWANLQGADMYGAQLQGAIMYEANLQGADMRSAQPQGAYMRSAQLQGAEMRYAQLQGADMSYAQLQGVVMENAQLQGAEMGSANADLADFAKIYTTPLTDKEWDEIKTMVKGNRNAEERIEEAMKRKEILPPQSYKNAYFKNDPPWELDNKHKYFRIDQEKEYAEALAPYLTRLTCAEPAAAKGIEERFRYESYLKPHLPAFQSRDCKKILAQPAPE